MDISKALLIEVEEFKKYATAFNKKDIYSVKDLLECFPVSYKINTLDNINDVGSGNKTFFGKVISNPLFRFHRANLSSIRFDLLVDENIIKVTVFNQRYLMKLIKLDSMIYCSGSFDYQTMQINVNKITLKYEIGKIETYYHNTILSDYQIRNLVKKAFKIYEDELISLIPNDLKEKYRLLEYKEAIYLAHFPESVNDVKNSLRTMKYQELLLFQLEILLYQKGMKKSYKEPKNYDVNRLKDFIKNLPFELTLDQKQVVNDAIKDMLSTNPANRLIQGDVGSGKTIVAIIILLVNYLAGYVGVFMAPTEILAIQHYDLVKAYFEALGINIVLLTGSIKQGEREKILKDLENEKVDIVVGTHALINSKVIFNKLGAVIVDEQHRFGVNQRSVLRKKGVNPDVFCLTATPIPRTMAITIFGDMDISSIKAMPLGRKKIITKIVPNEKKDSMFSFFKKEIELGHQVYVVAPMIDDEFKESINVYDLFEEVKDHFQEKVGLLHGRLGNVEKKNVMNDFLSKKIMILVSTTVIEVGVDVKDATIMAVFGADRFGLSTLHQLRGRVGRNQLQSYCFLLSDKKNNERLKIMEEVSDGFLLSEKDLELRGPGEVFGHMQSGDLNLKFADIIEDKKILDICYKDAHEIIDLLAIKKQNYDIIMTYLKGLDFINEGILD